MRNWNSLIKFEHFNEWADLDLTYEELKHLVNTTMLGQAERLDLTYEELKQL